MCNCFFLASTGNTTPLEVTVVPSSSDVLPLREQIILIEEDDIQQIPSTYQISERVVEKELGFEENIRNIISYYKTPIMISNLFG